ncbi:MAG: MFS transporter [Candidatus Acidiferrales bacterium]|jgi:MFS family permease
MKYQHRVLGLLSLLSIITYVDRVCISVAGPRIQDDLHISPEAWGWVTGVFALSYGLFEIPTGALGDRIGPRKVLTRIVLWWSVFTSLTGAVSNYFLLLLIRFCFGIGEAGAYPNAAAVLARWIPARHRARAWGIVWMTSQIGGAISPLLVVPIQERYGWRASFFVFGVLGLIWGGAWYGWFRDSPAEKPKVTQAERDEIGDFSSGARHGMPWGIALKSGNLWRVMATAACYVYALYFFQSWFHTYLVKGRGYGENELWLSSLPYLVGACANGLGGVTSDWLVRAFGLKTGRRISGLVGLGTATLFMVATILTTSGALALVFLSLVYGGMTFQQPVICAVCLDIGGKHAGAVMGFGNSAAQAGSLASSVAFGYLVERYGSYNAPLIPMAAVLSIGALLWLWIDPTRELFAEKIQIVGAVAGQ